jgi:hypothetical protein
MPRARHSHATALMVQRLHTHFFLATVGQLAAMCAWARGAKRVIAIDEVPARLEKVKVELSLPGGCMRSLLH